MERYDVLDSKGKPTGRTKNKGEYGQGDFYLGVHCYIEDIQGRFLLQRRDSSKSFRPGCWDIHLGHVVAGESSLESMRREVLEEVGLDRAEEDFHFVGRLLWEGKGHFTDMYHLKTDFAVEDLTIQEEELSELKLIDRDEMLDMIGAMDYRPAEYRSLMLDYFSP